MRRVTISIISWARHLWLGFCSKSPGMFFRANLAYMFWNFWKKVKGGPFGALRSCGLALAWSTLISRQIDIERFPLVNELKGPIPPGVFRIIALSLQLWPPETFKVGKKFTRGQKFKFPAFWQNVNLMVQVARSRHFKRFCSLHQPSTTSSLDSMPEKPMWKT